MPENSKELNKLAIIAIVIVIIGALAWGWLGVTGTNPITWANSFTFKSTGLERIIYVIVGISGLYVGYALITMGKKNK